MRPVIARKWAKPAWAPAFPQPLECLGHSLQIPRQIPGRVVSLGWILGQTALHELHHDVVVGARSSSMGAPRNSFWAGQAIHRAHLFAFRVRALSVAIPVLAYICR